MELECGRLNVEVGGRMTKEGIQEETAKIKGHFRGGVKG